ncbi:OmpA family protein [Cytophagaceae bacterium ABcell3]|nr:OmpA family protein [Cytophagaceae bacterium ABcell3]
MRYFAFVLFFLTVFAVSAQERSLSTTNKKAKKLYQKADELIKQRDFDSAIDALKKAVKKDPEFTEAYLRLGSSYKLLRNDKEARKNFLKAVELKPDHKELAAAYQIVGEYYFKDGDYDNALVYLQKMLKHRPSGKGSDAARKMAEQAEFGIEAKKNPLQVNPERLPKIINQFQIHAFPVLTADNQTLVFTKRDGVRPTDDEDIMISHRKDNGWSAPEPISPVINTRQNEGACTMSADGRVLVFASCNRQDSYGSCDLYVSFRSGNQWTKPANMGPAINSSSWDSEPALSADGRKLFFSSDRPGGKGKEDIWVSYLDEDGEWTEAVNLGEPINTSGREVTPFIHAGGNSLYFASDTHPGMGGFDIFVSRLEDEQWGEPENIGYPINTHLNDNTIFITADGEKGYYSTYKAEEGKANQSFLYKFDIPEALKEKQKTTYAKGKVSDAVTSDPLGATVELIDLESGKTIQSVSSDPDNGAYMIVLTEGREYGLYVQKNGYLFYSGTFDYNTEETFDPVNLDVGLFPIKAGNATVLKNIYFEVNSYKLEEKSKTELDKIVRFMEGNPDVKIEFGGHTDNTGNEKANQELSLNRAKSVYDYIELKGIDSSRLSYKGYGQSKPVAPNDTEENRRLNRRIEFQVM